MSCQGAVERLQQQRPPGVTHLDIRVEDIQHIWQSKPIIHKIFFTYLLSVDLDSYRAADKFTQIVAENAYSTICETFSCPSDFVLEPTLSRRGRRLKCHDSRRATQMTMAFMAQPRLASYFEHLKFTSAVSGKDITKNKPLMLALPQMTFIKSLEF